jgi:predicted nucleic acid-binding protein
MTMTMTTTPLVDSSAWIDFLRRNDPLLRPLIEDNSAAHTEPIAMELLSGTTAADDTRKVERLLLRSPLLAFDSVSDFSAATGFRRQALRSGLRVGLIDCLILAVADRHGVPLLTRDRPQAELARAMGVRCALLTDDT